jgi:hypothetical protein
VSNVFVALAVSVDGDTQAGTRLRAKARRRGDAAPLATSERGVRRLRLSEPTAQVFDAIAGRVGARLAGPNNYDKE